MKLSDIFKTQTPESVKANEETRDKHRDAVKSVILSARKCLENEDFKRYQLEYAKAYDELLADLLAYNEPDPLKYAFHVKQLQLQLQMVINLMSKVLRDASRQEPNEK